MIILLKEMIDLLEFLETEEFEKYNFKERIGDCEPSLTMFNWVTPMAICIEAILRIACIEYGIDKHYTDKEFRDMHIYALISIIEIKKILHDWGITDVTITGVKTLNYDNNTYKHALQIVHPLNPTEKKVRFRTFYSFVSGYYYYCTGKKAPSWNDIEYARLIRKETEEYKEREQLLFGTRCG